MDYYVASYEGDWVAHHGIMGQRWGVRRFQNPDGTLTAKGRKRYNKYEKQLKKQNTRLSNKNGKLAEKRAKVIKSSNNVSKVNKKVAKINNKMQKNRLKREYNNIQLKDLKNYTVDRATAEGNLKKGVVLGYLLGGPVGGVAGGMIANKKGGYDEYSRHNSDDWETARNNLANKEMHKEIKKYRKSAKRSNEQKAQVKKNLNTKTTLLSAESKKRLANAKKNEMYDIDFLEYTQNDRTSETNSDYRNKQYAKYLEAKENGTDLNKWKEKYVHDD